MNRTIDPAFVCRAHRAWLAVPAAMLSVFVWSNGVHAQSGRQLFVSPSGSDSNPGTELQPLRTIQHAADVVNAGDTVTVEDGTYTASGASCGTRPIVCLTRGGSAGSMVTFRARHRGGARLSGQNNSATDGFVFVSGANYITIDGFEIFGVGNASGSSSGIEVYDGGQHSVISHNDIHDVGRICTNTSNGEVGIFIEQPGVRVEGNRIHNIGRFVPGENGCSTSGGYYTHDHGVYVDGESGASGIPGASNTFIANNVFYNNARGWSIQVYPGSVSGLSILNNTFAFPNPDQEGHIILGASISNGRIANNIFYKPNNAAIDYYQGSMNNLQVTENLVFGASILNSTPSGTLVTANQTADPMFTSATAPYDFRPKSGSPAIDGGMTFVEVPVDIDGAARSGSYDLGAYETSSGGGGVQPTVSAPVISPDGGTISGPVAVTLATSTAGATIRYTLDGSAPTSSSSVYSGPIAVSTSLTLRTQAFATGMNNSSVTQASFQLQTSGGGGSGGSLPSGWTSRDIGAVGPAGSATASSGVFTVTGAGADIWSSADAFRYAYVPFTGDGSIVARVASVQNVNAWTKAGVMIRQTLDPQSANASMLVSPGKGLTFQRRTFSGALTTSTLASGSAPKWVRLTRAGQVFTAAVSSDGSSWITVGQQTISMSTSVFAGLAVTSHDASQAATASLDHVAVTATASSLPSGWQNTDVGPVGIKGSTSSSGGTFTVSGSGADIWGSADAFQFAYRTLNGDGQLVARVAAIDNTNRWAKAGVMVRASLSGSSSYAMMLVSAGAGSAFQWRGAGGASAASVSGGSGVVAPKWIKIVRSGNLIRGYQSSDGVSWQSVGSATIQLNASVMIGLAVTSHDNTKVAKGTFDSVK